MILSHPLPSSIVDLGAPPPVSPAAEAAMARIWERDLADPKRILFNGTLFSIAEIGEGRVAGHFVEYRRFHAQYREPSLFAELRVRPLGVTGVLRVAEGLVFGRRGEAVAQDAGAWELAPAGGIDPEARVEGRIDPTAQLLIELREELGLDPRRVTRAVPFCLVEDTLSRVVDLGISLETDCRAADLRPSAEYSRIEVVPEAEVAAFVAGGVRLTDICRALLAKRGLVPDAGN